jgi:Tfp pilus assembly PilM family ATPase
MLSFHRWWGRTTIPVVGVDISASGVRVMELAPSGRHVQIAHYAHQRLPAGAIREGSVVMRDAVCDALRDALRESGSRLRHAALALPASAVIKKTLSLPAQSTEDELEMHVEAEAMALLPVAREEIGVDFAVMGPSFQQVDAIDVMLVAARQEKINERAELALAVGLKAQIIDVESQALMSAIGLMVRSSDPAADGLLGVIQIESDQVHAYFMQGEALVFERYLGSLLLRKEASAVEAICQEFNRAFQLSQTSAGQASLHHIYLLGTAPADLQSALAQQMSVAVSAIDPWQQLAVKPGVMSDDHEHPSACTLVCGLALRSFD